MGTDRHRMRILVVEDEPLIAMEIEEVLTDAGYEVVELAASVERALSSLDGLGFDCAVLDANLGGKSAEPIAAALHRRSIPFVGLSGYSADQRPESFEGAPFLTKPFSPSDLVGVLERFRNGVLAR